jgi:carbon-monoxide dehydrogenase small subunit
VVAKPRTTVRETIVFAAATNAIGAWFAIVFAFWNTHYFVWGAAFALGFGVLRAVDRCHSAVAQLAFRWLVPEDVFPVTFRRGGNAAHLDLGGDRGSAIVTAMRDQLGLTGAKRGCNQGVCGSCTVAIDGWPVRGCLSLAAACEGREIITIEGAGDDPAMGVLQRQFAERGAVQCGFCTPGMLISARRLIADTPRPGVEEVQAALSGNICRCTGYMNIVKAIQAAGRDLAEAPAESADESVAS